MTTMPALTTHQRKVLDYLLAFFDANDMLPASSAAEMASFHCRLRQQLSCLFAE